MECSDQPVPFCRLLYCRLGRSPLAAYCQQQSRAVRCLFQLSRGCGTSTHESELVNTTVHYSARKPATVDSYGARCNPMFEPSTMPRVFSLPPGCDFANELVTGLGERLATSPPTAMAEVQIHVGTASLRQSIVDACIGRGNSFIPRIRLLSDLAIDPDFPEFAGPVSDLFRELQLTEAVAALLREDERFAPRATAYALAVSLVRLMDELQDRNISPESLRGLDVGAHSSHWEQSLKFINIIDQYWRAASIPTSNARRHMVTEAQIARWQQEPPDHPIIVAGSTGSQGTTLKFMQAVALLPQGALVLPCFDTELPAESWNRLNDPATSESHPQYRFVELVQKLDIAITGIKPWRPCTRVDIHRNRLISLALRPAPVTDQWLIEGPRLRHIPETTQGFTLIEAATPREEAAAIALRMRAAVNDCQSIALVTPDRTLARRVKAALRRWTLVPRDSVGDPFTRTPQGRFLVQIANLMGRQASAEDIVALLKNPMTHSEHGRSRHLERVRSLESFIRFRGPEFDPAGQLQSWGQSPRRTTRARNWLAWHEQLFENLATTEPQPFKDLVRLHVQIAKQFAQGPDGEQSTMLWGRKHAASRRAKSLMAELCDNAHSAGPHSTNDYANIFFGVASRIHIREPYKAHPLLSIWNTEDVRMQQPDVVITGGLNEGSWPLHLDQDIWMNRDLRLQLGLQSPERRIGMSAHDFQQAVSLPEVVLTRSIRGADEANIPNRWLSRLVGLLEGSGLEGKQALKDMRERGENWLQMASAIDQPDEKTAPAHRPFPAPPQVTRPRTLSVSEISLLVSDPYAIYSRHVLELRPMSGLTVQISPLLRGIKLHALMNEFVQRFSGNSHELDRQVLIELARQYFAGTGASPHVESFWLGQLEFIADEIVQFETRQRGLSFPDELEQQGEFHFEELDFTLVGRVDRLDLIHDTDNEYCLFDYKSGRAPTPIQILRGDKQLPLLAMMVEKGVFSFGQQESVSQAAYICVDRELETRCIDRFDGERDLFREDWQDLQRVIEKFCQSETALMSRRLTPKTQRAQPYDHLARFGEWDDSCEPCLERLT